MGPEKSAGETARGGAGSRLPLPAVQGQRKSVERTKKDRSASAGVARAVEGELTVKGKQPMPRYYGKNIVRHAQKKFFQRKAMEAERERRLDDLRDEKRLYEAEKRTDEYERGERDHL